MSGMVFTAYQKLYSALSNLDRFNKKESFFDNMSSLDCFFSEFRNITFVLQKSIANTRYLSIYDANRERYLSNCKWFIGKRNETTKEHPFQLTKQVEITVYFPDSGSCISRQQFTLDDDLEISTLIDKFRQLFLKINPLQVFFSAKFSFFEKDSQEDLYDKLILGIQSMANFLEAMYTDIDEHCELCEQLMRRIEKLNFSILPKDMLLVNDYAYYPQRNEFERAERISILMQGHRKTINRTPLSRFSMGMFSNFRNDYFRKFVAMHAIQQNTELLTTIMIVFQDETFELDSFNADIKTTIYRKLNETAMLIRREDVKEVYYMQVYVAYPLPSPYLSMTSKERLVHAQKEYLSFMKVDRYLNEEEYDFEGDKLNNMKYIKYQILNGKKKQLDFGKINMTPIIQAFKKSSVNMPPDFRT